MQPISKKGRKECKSLCYAVFQQGLNNISIRLDVQNSKQQILELRWHQIINPLCLVWDEGYFQIIKTISL